MYAGLFSWAHYSAWNAEGLHVPQLAMFEPPIVSAEYTCSTGGRHTPLRWKHVLCTVVSRSGLPYEICPSTQCHLDPVAPVLPWSWTQGCARGWGSRGGVGGRGGSQPTHLPCLPTAGVDQLFIIYENVCDIINKFYDILYSWIISWISYDIVVKPMRSNINMISLYYQISYLILSDILLDMMYIHDIIWMIWCCSCLNVIYIPVVYYGHYHRYDSMQSTWHMTSKSFPPIS